MIAVFGATLTPSYQQCEGSYQTRSSGTKNNNLSLGVPTSGPTTKGGFARFMRCQGVAIDANNATLTAIATVFLTVITGVMAWLAYRQNVTARAELRAYVSVEPSSTPGFRQRPGLLFEFRPDIVNNGQTPANRVQVISRIDVSPFNVPSNFVYRIPPNPPGRTKSVLTLGAAQKRFHNCIMPRRVTWNEMRRIAKGELWFHIWGTITYFDIFEAQHFTNFSYVVFVPVRKELPHHVALHRTPQR
ncbi:MAG: hypothetical protein ACRD33_05065 [Candidatus Acidiferrales bacterium]